MKVILQRVLKAECIVEQKVISAIDKGFMLLVGFTHSDTEKEVEQMASKIAKLRVFEDANGKMNLSLNDVKGSILSISQFTLYANTKEGNRPSFIDAMRPNPANILYQKFNEKLISLGIKVYSGVFGADMKLNVTCDGPVTIQLEY